MVLKDTNLLRNIDCILYRVISSIYFPLKIKKIEYRFNHRNENLIIRFKEVIESTIFSCQITNLA